MTLRVEFLIFHFKAAFLTRRLMAVLLFVSIGNLLFPPETGVTTALRPDIVI